MLTLDDLCSPAYRAQLNEMYAKKAWSGGGAIYANEIVRLVQKTGATSLLDYGCGNVDMAAVLGPLARFTPPLRVESYDPGVPGRDGLPGRADVVVCVDVLEHVEPDKVRNVLDHLHSLVIKTAIIVIATRPADKRLPDGRNAHLTIDNSGWWKHQFFDTGGWKGRVIKDKDGILHMWLRNLDATSPLDMMREG